MNILAFSGSNSSTSINQALIRYTAQEINAQVINLRDYNFPMYSEDLEKEKGIPADIKALMEQIIAADAVIISTPEHNANLPAFFKNVLDWLSRTGVKFLEGKKVLIMSTSNGKGGAGKAAGLMDRPIHYAGGEIHETFSLPQFSEHFDYATAQMTDQEWKERHHTVLNAFKESIRE